MDLYLRLESSIKNPGQEGLAPHDSYKKVRQVVPTPSLLYAAENPEYVSTLRNYPLLFTEV